ncbi:hypothetical protein AMATHDRAFT_129737, partial [Amanita thiersii Skay4041]
SRPLDFLYFIFFLVHIPATILIDAQSLYPTWLLPEFFKALPRYYVQMSGDPLLGGITGFLGQNSYHLIWLKCFIVLEVVFQLPVFIFGLRGLYNGDRPIYVLLLIYAASTATTTIPCLAVVLQTPETTATTISQNLISITWEQRLLLLSSYLPFLLVPLTMTVDMGFRVLDLVTAGMDAIDADKWK